MKNRAILIPKLVFSIIFDFIVISLAVTSSHLMIKVALIPFIICGLSISAEIIFDMMDKPKYVKMFSKLYSASFLLYGFGFMSFWCYLTIKSKSFGALLFSIPFWITLVSFTKNIFFNNKEKKKSRDD